MNRSLPHLPAESTPEVVCRRAGGSEQEAVLSMLLTGQAHGGRAAVRDFQQFALGQQMPLREVWGGWEGGRLRGAALIVPSAGRAGMLFLSPTVLPERVRVMAELVHTVCQAQDPAGLRLIQALLDPGQRYEAQALAEAGFLHLADLSYQQRRVERVDESLTLEAGVEAATWSEKARPLFAQAILASYEATRDCPALVGLRGIDDIIAGHMAGGCFQPELWLALHQAGRPVGVMLLNPSAVGEAVELVYLGLAPAWRGRGLGRRLVRHALALSYRRRARQMLLAVDEANEPAVRLYRSLGFAPTARKVAMIHTLDQKTA